MDCCLIACPVLMVDVSEVTLRAPGKHANLVSLTPVHVSLVDYVVKLGEVNCSRRAAGRSAGRSAAPSLDHSS
jgi:hypothetical protein